LNSDDKTTLWRQFGAAIDMLDNAMLACPDSIWSDSSSHPEFWHVAYHTLFWLDFYLSDSPEGFTPPPPFKLEELDPAGRMPERVYTRKELGAYLEHGRAKCRARIESLTEETALRRFKFGSIDFSIAELLLYNMRHVQHHAAQLNLVLRQRVGSAPRWVGRVKS
jgi:uncharacterized damage-inducible protein DinB